MTPADPSSKAGRWLCANCYRQLAPADRFCANCGQSAQRHVPTFSEFVHEFFSHYVALERGVLWRSLAALVFRPGKLAREYFAGRRGRYVPPLRLYLTASIVFFVAIKLFGPAFDDVTVATAAPQEKAATEPAKVQVRFPGLQQPWGGSLDPLRLKLNERIARFEADAQRDGAKVLVPALRNFVQSLYYAMFLMLPLYAMLLALVYIDKPRSYGEHLVVGLYMHAMVFFMLLALYFLTWPWLQAVILLWLLAHPYVALRRTYGGGRWGTFWRASVLGTLYLAASGPVIVVFFALAIIV